jgi:hypothetical protein
MIIARLKVGAQSIDDIRLIISANIPTIINLKGQRSALNLWSALAKSYMADSKGRLTINIDGIDYRFSERHWSAIFSVVDQWFEASLPTEYAELQAMLFGESPESAEIIPLGC